MKLRLTTEYKREPFPEEVWTVIIEHWFIVVSIAGTVMRRTHGKRWKVNCYAVEIINRRVFLNFICSRCIESFHSSWTKISLKALLSVSFSMETLAISGETVNPKDEKIGPVEIILSTLPARTLFTCTQVCRLWRDIARRIIRSRQRLGWLSFITYHELQSTPSTSKVRKLNKPNVNLKRIWAESVPRKCSFKFYSSVWNAW